MLQWSKRLAQKPRSLQPISPRQFNRFCNSDPQTGGDLGFAEPRMQREWRLIQRQRIVFDGDAERLAELAGPGTQRALLLQAAAAAHRRQTVGRLQRADQHGAGRACRLADEIQAPVDAVGAVDIGKTRRAEHHEDARRGTAKRVRGRVQMVIGLALGDAAADAVDQKRRPDQVGGYLMYAAIKKRAFQRLAEARGGGIGRLWIWNHFQVGITSEQMKTANMLHVSARFGEPDCGLPQSDCGPSSTGVAAMGDTD